MAGGTGVLCFWPLWIHRSLHKTCTWNGTLMHYNTRGTQSLKNKHTNIDLKQTHTHININVNQKQSNTHINIAFLKYAHNKCILISIYIYTCVFACCSKRFLDPAWLAPTWNEMLFLSVGLARRRGAEGSWVPFMVRFFWKKQKLLAQQGVLSWRLNRGFSQILPRT